jgi:hypothetical protein
MMIKFNKNIGNFKLGRSDLIRRRGYKFGHDGTVKSKTKNSDFLIFAAHVSLTAPCKFLDIYPEFFNKAEFSSN